MSEVSMFVLISITDLLVESDTKRLLVSACNDITKLLAMPAKQEQAEENLLELQTLASRLLKKQNEDKTHKEIHDMIVERYSKLFSSGIIPTADSPELAN